MSIFSDPGAIRSTMIRESLEENHEFKCSCKICARGPKSFFESAEQVIKAAIKNVSSDVNNRQLKKAQQISEGCFDRLNNKKSMSLNDYKVDSFIAVHILETIAYQCSFPFFSK